MKSVRQLRHGERLKIHGLSGEAGAKEFRVDDKNGKFR
jgi:hypothetical protein